MRVYSTYQEAKIANPECDIYNDTHGKFRPIKDAPTSHFANGWELCKPKNYCMTVEKFLVDGHRLEIDDWVIGVRGLTFQISSNEIDEWNVKSVTPMDSKLYILRAAALETKEQKRTKVEYVNIGRDWNAWEFLKAYSELPDSEQWFIKVSDDQYVPIHDWFVVAKTLRAHNLVYQRIETHIEWWEDAAEFVKPIGHSEIVNGQLLVEAAMTRDQWCDFARILLEQGE